MKNKTSKKVKKDGKVGKPSRFKLLLSFLKGSKGFFAVSIIASLVMAISDLINPQIIRYTVDTLIGHEPSSMPDFVNRLVDSIGGVDYLRQRLWIVSIAIVAVALTAAFLRYVWRMFNTYAAETLVQRIRNLLFEHIQKLPFSFHMKNQTGDIIQRCTSDVDTVKNFLSEQLTGLLQVIMQVGTSMWMMFSMSPGLACVSAATMPIILIYSAAFGKKIGEGFRRCDEAEGQLSACTQENLTGVRVVRAFGREKHERERFRAYNDKFTSLWVKLARLTSAFWGFGDLFSGLQIMLILILGVYFCVYHGMTAGELIAFLSYNAMLSWPIRRLGRMISEMSKASISIDRLAYILDSPVETDDPDASEPPLDGDVVFDNVSFAYDGCPELLHNISFTVKAGSTVGIIGGTGSGKSTLVYLLGRLYELPEGSGSITVGGVDIRKIKAKHLRRNVGIVLQEPYLFSRSIAENIAITSDCVNMEEVRRAAAVASLDDTVMSFAEGYDTFVGEKGVTLSGGQKQRTAIARMLTQNTPIMVFDDSLSAVDAETDAKIRQALSTGLGSSTVFLISHRTATLMNSDLIIVLDKGRIAEMGNHKSLMEREDGIYRRIYTAQMSDPDGEDGEGATA